MFFCLDTSTSSAQEQNEPKDQDFKDIAKKRTSSSKTNELTNVQTPFVFTSISVALITQQPFMSKLSI